jgi:hypothetical protein
LFIIYIFNSYHKNYVKQKNLSNITNNSKNNSNNHYNQITEIIHLNISSLNFTEFNVTTSNIKRKKNKNGFEYFCCFCTMGKNENMYVKDLISYYMSLGFDKFVFGDNNLANTVKFSDVLDDYINNGTVDVIDIIGKKLPQGTFFGIMYERYKTKCEWLSFFDIDEYLVMHFDEDRNITINEYVSNPIFNICDSILINWLVFGDNDLVHYDNRPVIDRFTKPLKYFRGNIFIKTLVRGNLTKVVFEPLKTHHHPNVELNNCNSMGEKIKFVTDTINPPEMKYAYLMHYTFRTAEERVDKIKRGHTSGRPRDIDKSIKQFFEYNKITEEKIQIFEKAFNISLNNYRNKIDNKGFIELFIEFFKKLFMF